jgi:AcrR family transcriptional regulator
MEERVQILEKSQELFMRYGVKSISMDDICRELGISKKTLYRFVSDKAELIRLVIERHTRENTCAVAQLGAAAVNAIDEMLHINRHVKQQMGGLNPALMFDLQKYYRQTWEVLRSHQMDFVSQTMRANIERGRWEGLYRTDFDADVIVRLYLAKVRIFIEDPSFLLIKDQGFPEVFGAIVDYHLRAIASPRGLEYYLRYLSDQWERGDARTMDG